MADPATTPPSRTGAFSRLLGYIRPYRATVVGVLALGAVISATTGMIAYAIRPLLDDVFIAKDASALAWLPWAVLGLFAVKTTCAYIQAVTVELLTSRVLMVVRNDFQKGLLWLPTSRFTSTASGEFVSRMTNDVTLLHTALGTVVRDVVQHSLTTLCLAAVVIYQDPYLAMITLGVIPLAFYPLILLSRRLRKRAKKGQEAVSELTQTLTETLGGIHVIKAFGTEERELSRFARVNHAYRSRVVRVARLARVPGPMMEFVGALGITGILAYGGARVIEGVTTPGAFFSFAAASMMLYGPVRALSNANSVIQQALVAARRIFEVIDLPKEAGFADHHLPALDPVCREVRLEGVGFGYREGGTPALGDISLTARMGEVVALVGPSGAGKTTLVNLLPRFLEVDDGVITIDGTDIRGVTMASLRRQIGIVGQDTVLFDDTVAANIAYGHPEVDEHGQPIAADVLEEAVTAAARKAHADDFIRALPEGYATRVGERGVALSGGQRQRIAIARALLKDAPILILDEATSALDAESERHVQAALETLMDNRTTFVIAHRLATIRHASQILVMDGGRIVERGTHGELMAGPPGLYRKLHDLQFRMDASATDTGSADTH